MIMVEAEREPKVMAPTPQHPYEPPSRVPAPSPEAAAAIRDSAEALARAVHVEQVVAPKVHAQVRKMSVSNHFVETFKAALGAA